MAKTEKEAVVADLVEYLRRAKTIVLTDYRGLNVGEATELRRRLREAGVDYKVVKNTMAVRAIHKAAIEGLEPYLVGPTAMAFGYGDPVAPAKMLAAFAKEHKNLILKAGMLEGSILDQAQVKALADLPTREQLLATLAGMLQAPFRGLVTVLSGPMRNLVYGLEALRRQRAGEA